MSKAASLKGTGFESARVVFRFSPFPPLAEQVQSGPQQSRARAAARGGASLDGEDCYERIKTGRKGGFVSSFFRPLQSLNSHRMILEAGRYATVGGPNQVVSASESPAWLRSPTQATYPSGRINTAEGALTAPSPGRSHGPMYLAWIN